jgi:hypothetical protein
MDAGDIPWLRALLGKIDTTQGMIAIHEPLEDMRAMVISKIDELGGKINED